MYKNKLLCIYKAIQRLKANTELGETFVKIMLTG